MARRVWIIAKKEEVEQSDIDDAIFNGCPEIANGIPPALKDIVSEAQLPLAYEEPIPPEPGWLGQVVFEEQDGDWAQPNTELGKGKLVIVKNITAGKMRFYSCRDGKSWATESAMEMPGS